MITLRGFPSPGGKVRSGAFLTAEVTGRERQLTILIAAIGAAPLEDLFSARIRYCLSAVIKLSIG